MSASARHRAERVQMMLARLAELAQVPSALMREGLNFVTWHPVALMFIRGPRPVTNGIWRQGMRWCARQVAVSLPSKVRRYATTSGTV